MKQNGTPSPARRSNHPQDTGGINPPVAKRWRKS